MKRLFKVIICLLMLFTIRVNAAASFNMNLSGYTNVNIGEEVDISISLANITDIPSGLNVCQATLTTSGVSASITEPTVNGWTTTLGGVLIMDSATSAKSNTVIGKIKVKVNSAGSLTLSNIMCTDGNEEYSASNRTINFTIRQDEPTTTTTTTTGQRPITQAPTTTQKNNNSTTTTITTTAAAKKSAFLNDLTIEGAEFRFFKNVVEYRIEVPNSVDKAKIKYELEDKTAKVKVEGTDALELGENNIDIVVTNEDSKVTYKLIIVRKEEVGEPENTEESILESLKEDKETITVKVDIDDSNKIITSKILEYLKENEKNIVYEVYSGEKLIYSFKVIGKNIDTVSPINYNIKFTSFNEVNIAKSFKKGQYKVVSFDYKGIFPKDTEIILYDLGFNSNNLYLYDYDFNNNKLELVKELVNGKGINLNVNNASEYVISDKEASSFNFIIILLTTLAVFIVLLLLIIIIKSNSVKKNNQMGVLN